MTAFLTLLACIAYVAVSNTGRGDVWLIVLMFVVGQVVTDFVSGMVHWSCDTWGKLDTPLVGPTFIRSFR